MLAKTGAVDSFKCMVRYLVPVFFLFYYSIASANSGIQDEFSEILCIPVVCLVWPVCTVLMFIPVVLIEWLVIKVSLPHINTKKVLLATVFANLFSSLVAIPLTMLFRLALDWATVSLWAYNESLSVIWQFICAMTLGAIWPYTTPWLAAVAFISLMIPCLFTAYPFKHEEIQGMLGKEVNSTLLRKVVWRANLASHALLLLPPVIYLVTNAGYIWLWWKSH